jgi:hypothetical protein
VVRIPSFARRSETAAVEDQNRDGRIDERDERPATGTAPVRDQVDDRGAYRGRSATDTLAERGRDTAVIERPAEREPEVVPAGPRPRASVLATLGLIVGVAAMLAVLSGVLLGYGVALGVVGLFLSIGGISATGRRHVAGKSDALLGAAFSVAAMVIGALALTGSLSWLSTEADKVQQLREWLDTQFANRV